jgi:hypothetical protein
MNKKGLPSGPPKNNPEWMMISDVSRQNKWDTFGFRLMEGFSA